MDLSLDHDKNIASMSSNIENKAFLFPDIYKEAQHRENNHKRTILITLILTKKIEVNDGTFFSCYVHTTV